VDIQALFVDICMVLQEIYDKLLASSA